MEVLKVIGLKKGYGNRTLFENISFNLQAGEKIGLIGMNGAGKSTLLKIIAGLEHPETGSISLSTNTTIGYLEQQPRYADLTVNEVLMLAFSEIVKVSHNLRDLEKKMADPENKDMDRMLSLYGTLLGKYEILGGYEYENKIEMIKTGFQLTDEFCNTLYDQLSGGEKTKVLLAKLLLEEPSVLLLDEPTNYLDLATLDWLENYVSNFKGSMIVVSHDRYFLDNVVDTIMELTPRDVEEYFGNYTYYVVEKQRRLTEQQKDYNDQQREIKRMNDQVQWLRSTGSNVLRSKSHQIAARIEKMDKLEKPQIDTKKMRMGLGGGRSGKIVINFENVAQGYDDILFEGLNGDVFFDDSIGIVGTNGVGKSTLIKTLLGEIEPLEGKIRIGNSVKLGYLDQESIFEDEEKTVLETYSRNTSLSEDQARKYLAKMLFTKEDVYKKIKVLSGGERKRLKLSILVHSKPNLLVLDEPTNHLDLESREQLEMELLNFPGTLVFVSHDRYFLNKMASKIWQLTPHQIYEIDGNYDDYIKHNRRNILSEEGGRKL